MNRATVNYCGVPMTVAYTYVPEEAQTWTEPGYPANAEIDSIQIAGVEVIDMLTEDQRDRVAELVLEARGDDDHNEAAEAYHRQRDERAAEGFLG